VLSLTNVILGCVAAVLGLGLAALLGVLGPGGHWPFAVPTTTSTSSVTSIRSFVEALPALQGALFPGGGA